MLLIFLFSIFGAIACQKCQSGTVTLPQDNACAVVEMSGENGYAAAKASCDEIGGNMLSIHNAFSNSMLVTYAMKYHVDDTFYIGADNQFHGEWKWADGSSMDYTNWGPQEPSKNSNMCATLKLSDGKWYADSCDKKIPYACEIPQIETGCPAGWKFFEDFCYYVNTFQHATWWKDARYTCTNMQADLASINSPNENDFLIRLLDGDHVYPWIGLMWNGTYSWSDGNLVIYKNLEDGPAPTAASVYAIDGYGATVGQWSGSHVHSSVSNTCICKKPHGTSIKTPPQNNRTKLRQAKAKNFLAPREKIIIRVQD